MEVRSTLLCCVGEMLTVFAAAEFLGGGSVDLDSVQALARSGDEAALLMADVEHGQEDFGNQTSLGEHGMAFGDEDDEDDEEGEPVAMVEDAGDLGAPAVTPATNPPTRHDPQNVRDEEGEEEEEEEDDAPVRVYTAPQTLNFWVSPATGANPPPPAEKPKESKEPKQPEKPKEKPRPGKEREREREREKEKEKPKKEGHKAIATPPKVTGPVPAKVVKPSQVTPLPTPSKLSKLVQQSSPSPSPSASSPQVQKRPEKVTPNPLDKKKKQAATPATTTSGKPRVPKDEIDSIFDGF